MRTTKFRQIEFRWQSKRWRMNDTQNTISARKENTKPKTTQTFAKMADGNKMYDMAIALVKVKFGVSHLHECYVERKTRQRYNGGISLLQSTHLLLNLLLLSGRTHLLAEGHVRDFKTSNGTDTDVEDGEKEDADDATHEDSWKRLSA
jgi:hypothetical protein